MARIVDFDRGIISEEEIDNTSSFSPYLDRAFRLMPLHMLRYLDWRYNEGYSIYKIAYINAIHPATVSRNLSRYERRLKNIVTDLMLIDKCYDPKIGFNLREFKQAHCLEKAPRVRYLCDITESANPMPTVYWYSKQTSLDQRNILHYRTRLLNKLTFLQVPIIKESDRIFIVNS